MNKRYYHVGLIKKRPKSCVQSQKYIYFTARSLFNRQNNFSIPKWKCFCSTQYLLTRYNLSPIIFIFFFQIMWNNIFIIRRYETHLAVSRGQIFTKLIIWCFSYPEYPSYCNVNKDLKKVLYKRINHDFVISQNVFGAPLTLKTQNAYSFNHPRSPWTYLSPDRPFMCFWNVSRLRWRCQNNKAYIPLKVISKINRID